MFGRLGRIVVRHPWWTIVAWLVVAAVVVAFKPTVHSKTDQADFLPSKYEAVQASKLADKAFPSADQKTSPALVVVKRTDGQALGATDTAKISGLATAIQNDHLKQVTIAHTGADTLAQAGPLKGQMQLIYVPLPNKFDQATQTANEDAVKGIRTLAADQLKGSGLTYGVTGDAATQVDNAHTNQVVTSLVTFGALLLILVILIIIFRAILATLIPLIVIGLVSVLQGAVNAYAAKAFGLSVDDSFSLIVEIVTVGVGADYMLFLFFRFRERLRLGEDKKTAMIETVSRVGEAIASAAGAVAVAFLVLLLAQFKSFGALGPQLAIAVGVLFVTALTLVPAVLSLIGSAVFWPSKAWKKEPKDRMWARLGQFVGRRPSVAALSSGLLLLVLATGTLGFKSDYNFSAGSPQNTESAKFMKDVTSANPAGILTPTHIYLKSSTPLDKTQVDAYTAKIKQGPGVGGVKPALYGSDNKVADITVVLKLDPNSNEAITLVKDKLKPYAHENAPPGTQALVGGFTAIWSDINSVMNRDLSVILPVAVLLIAVILALLLRALVAPVYLVIAVLLGFAATLGAVVWMFQGIQGKPGIMFNIPIILYLFVMAIGTDYNILMIARLREEAREGKPPREAARLGVHHAGPTVAAAGILLAGTFAMFIFTPISFMQEVGFGVAIGIIIAAFVMSAFLVPGVTALLGHKAWWPGHGDAGHAPATEGGGNRDEVMAAR